MSSLEAKRLYYDTNTGLMPIIQALIAPPVTEEDGDTERRVRREKKERKPETKKEGLDLHPYYKKRGRSHNHDYCDACLEGGNLLCCDTCEASFHLECNDPPLHVDEIPLDMWQCRRCTKLHTESSSKKSSSSPGKSGKRRKSTNSNNSATSSHAGVSKTSSSSNSRGRPRKHPITPVVPKPSDKSDSDTGSVDSTRSKRFIKRRKKEPPNPDRKTPPESKSPATPVKSSEDHTNNNRHNSSSSDDEETRTNKTRVTPPSTRVTPSKLDNSGSTGGTAGHIGYLKYSSSEDEDSNSEKSLYFRDVIGENKKTEEYLDENTGEIVSRSLCENEYLNKLLAKKNTTKEIDDIERINEILLKTENMRMDSNIIKKIIGCSIPDNEQSDSEGDHAYDTDPDEGTSDEGVEEKKSCDLWSEGGNDSILHNNKDQDACSHLLPFSVSVTLSESDRDQVTPDNNQPSNISLLPSVTTLAQTTPLPSTVPDPIPPPIQLSATTKIKQEVEEVNEEKPIVDEDLCSLLKFDALWKEKFALEETKEHEEETEDVGEGGGGGSDSYEEWDDEEEEEEREE
uniref:PHD finger protein 12 n=1 Tax=Cacopsylla melanoneura TaxID=428564 RepID=A0A8D8SX46_9HEMI